MTTVSDNIWFKGYSVSTVTRAFADGGISFSYKQDSADSESGATSSSDISMSLDLMPYLKGTLVAGSLMFKIGSYTYVDRSGVLYHSVDPATGSGTKAGTINYSSGVAVITAWPAGAWSFSLLAGLVNPGTPGVSGIVGRTSSRPLKSQSFTLKATATDGTSISATASAAGTLSDTLLSGSIDADTGVFKLSFGKTVDGSWESSLVDPSTASYNAVAYSYLPLDADQIGIDPVRLPTDGKVPVFREGDFAVLSNSASCTVTVSAGQTINLGRTRLSRIIVKGYDGSTISTGYSEDLDAGTITFASVSGYSQPVTITDRIEDMSRISDVQISGQVTFTRQISHAYPAGSMLSSALVIGDMYAHAKNVFDINSWDKATWSDTLSGSAASATYDTTNYPIQVTNAGAVTERWALYFTNTTTVQVYGEHLGMIATLPIASAIAPTNPATGEPYFTILPAGWGNAWSAGNALRFNTVGAIQPFWIARTVQQGTETVTDDSLSLEGRGDVNAD